MILVLPYNVKVGKNLKKLYGRGHVCGFSFRLDYAAKAKCIVRCTVEVYREFLIT